MISEMIHTASLVHDDVIDGSDQRRGKRTINEVWGEKKVRETKSFGLMCFSQSSICMLLVSSFLGHLSWRFHPLSCLDGLGSYR